MNKIIRIIAAAAFTLGMSAACTDLSDFEDRIDSLEGRVTALETQIKGLNANIEALQQLVAGGTINSATNNNGVWTLVLTNGETLTLTQGSIGVGNAPVMSVNKDGYWMVDYGTGATYILIDGNKVKAIGTDGKTPVFGVDANGFWTVSYDDGKTYTQVKGADGNPVSALPQGDAKDPYFEDVKLVDGNLVITLRSGEKITVPVLTDFLCAIENEGLQLFAPGEIKPFNVAVKGVKSTMITAPAGWVASLSEAVEGKAVLTVTAPKGTKSTVADSGADVTILAFSEQNYAAISKIQVQLTDAPVVFNPVANVTAGEATETALTYNVATSDATSWKYICQKEGDAAPDAAKIAAEGTEGTGTSVTIEGLESGTAYVLYVLPVNGSIQGPVASATNTTKKQLIASYYALYNAGQPITIDGVTISKETHGDATLLEADANITTNGVYFLKEGVTATYTGTGAIKKFIVIGDKEGTRSTFKSPVDAYMKLNGNGDGTGYVVFHNVVFDQTTTSTQYAITVNFNEAFPIIMFSDCEIRQNSAKPIFYISSATRSITDLRFVNCDCKVTAAQPFLSCGSSTAAYGTYTVKNCVFYGDGTKGFNLHGGNKVVFGNIVFTNNTFVNVLAGSNVWFNCGTITKATVTGNLLYMAADKLMENNQSILNSANALITGGTIENNIFYTGQEKSYMAIYGGKDKWFEGVKEITKLTSDPFTGGTFDLSAGKFVPGSEYASYGALR